MPWVGELSAKANNKVPGSFICLLNHSMQEVETLYQEWHGSNCLNVDSFPGEISLTHQTAPPHLFYKSTQVMRLAKHESHIMKTLPKENIEFKPNSTIKVVLSYELKGKPRTHKDLILNF